MAGMRAEDVLQQAKAYIKKTVIGMGAIQGQQGDPERDGRDGVDGQNGIDSVNGKSAYDIWLDKEDCYV